MFSTDGTMPTTFNGSFNDAIALIVPRTVHPPHLSNFISSILSPGFSEIPPVSKVTAFPTRRYGFLLSEAPLYSTIIILGGLLLPFPTATIPANPIDSISYFSMILVLIEYSFASDNAQLAKYVGEHSFGGRLLKSRVKYTASTIVFTLSAID